MVIVIIKVETTEDKANEMIDSTATYKMAIALHLSTSILPFLLVLMSATVSYAMADAAKDREECAQQLVGLLCVCLTLVDKQKHLHQTVALVLNKS